MEILFLGTGAAEGIPSIGCRCGHCRRARREGGHLQRDRSAILVRMPNYNLLIDTPPRVRRLLDQHAITRIDGIFLTHEHHDHAAGLNEFKYWPRRIDLLAAPAVYRRVRRREWGERLPEIAFYLPCRPGIVFNFDGFFLVSFQVEHSAPTYGLALVEDGRKVIIASDSGPHLSGYARCLIEGADVLIINAPFFSAPERADHIDVQQSLTLKERVHVKRLVLTHINHHNKPHDELEAFVSRHPGVTVAYDGWRLKI